MFDSKRKYFQCACMYISIGIFRIDFLNEHIPWLRSRNRRLALSQKTFMSFINQAGQRSDHSTWNFLWSERIIIWKWIAVTSTSGTWVSWWVCFVGVFYLVVWFFTLTSKVVVLFAMYLIKWTAYKGMLWSNQLYAAICVLSRSMSLVSGL